VDIWPGSPYPLGATYDGGDTNFSAKGEPMPHDRPGVVIDEREQVGLAARDDWAVQGIAGPQLIGPGRFEPAEHRLGPG
jgi:hypothetical protein